MEQNYLLKYENRLYLSIKCFIPPLTLISNFHTTTEHLTKCYFVTCPFTKKTLPLQGIFGLLQNTQSFFGVFVTIVGIIENLFRSNFSPDIFTFICESPKICIFLQENQIPPGLNQNHCYIGFSKITNLLKLCLLYCSFFGFFRFFSKVPKF